MLEGLNSRSGSGQVEMTVMEEPYLQVRGLSVRFPGGIEALAQLNLEMRRGDFVSIVGPSGCGKSTLLRVVAGLLSPTEGEVRVDGVSPVQARRERQEVSFVFQTPTLLPWRSVAANVRLPLELRGAPASLQRSQIQDVLAMVGLSQFERAYPHQLSGGMQMRVSLARALITRPDLLLLDEPFGALDEITRERLNEELLTLWMQDRWTALFVTHSVYEAVFLSTRVLVMSPRPGRFIAEVRVPFPYPRRPELRGQSAFAQLAAEVSSRLRGMSP